MPELPEVEVCRLGISPHIINNEVSKVVVRNAKLRWPIPDDLQKLIGLNVKSVDRRAKYLLLRFDTGSLLLHLGMSGTLRVIDKEVPVAKHDHFDLVFANGVVLRLNDPRRFGAVLWFDEHYDSQGLLSKLGPEPLTDDFGHDYLFNKAKKRKVPIKTFLMNNHVVVGVGNIYANEALFLAGILPTALAGSISRQRYNRLTDIIKQVLAAAIEQGGTTLKDFTQADGRPGYFAQSLFVYGRAGEACLTCKETLLEVRQSNRSSVYCPNCQQD
ncbi:bifunctional DNA-formamidopyrimidine glycosylase/DNA-(apurinic or apyrimidinic site) lyase [Colwellia sp. 4_MG-2023]|jgi:formamidopyrimidine-DNA glycosylase|uniref:bifunctional DNA-formamidopyrimidine glycosylase/DNA-(apurinic or apyrimidinic site) lyase n=1 Tax=unclassified Colwellia TaxID=196834 RepID=UPI001C08E8C4|nr:MULTISPECIES: bifunctional DNA-formamidopyrimidine glycosylase/DNA-(apurinic or apyrimidinic site) lyase [unclassified Colwellia]MBU2923690.1 bifunctional DNA-formamidopyrimidine glycosylase/DNA-(apurinic or apyrimidinic site) lyase [Colwellia sp. C2M11]MDO6505787.1 bifunctional DNA-formamidopyrimidine glycosylase/DNA-(apurinic or apyrimidinic site) lyase [Colwellia sp. 5_MG-2023]MDO6554468.1 bifunctional DNA-formamidopyrimidine glycosylase/DNA-(apurinic or apyrimidinic site) lyase [Colwellia